MNNDFNPLRLHVAPFAQLGESHTGAEPLSRFERLMEETHGQGGPALVEFALSGSTRTDSAGLEEPWMHLSAHAILSLVCQRCLGPVDVPVQFARDFRFVASEELAELQDEESEEDVLVISKAFNVLELMEDELLMAMPPVPKHPSCPKPVKLQAADPNFCDEAAEKPNPFAVLQSLKKTAGS